MFTGRPYALTSRAAVRRIPDARPGSLGGFVPAPAAPQQPRPYLPAETAAAVDELSKRCDLSEREDEVLRWYVAGDSMRDMCDKLFISRNTIKTHMRHIHRKLGLHTRAETRELIQKTVAAMRAQPESPCS